MTVATPEPGGVPTQADEWGDVGLEDVDATDVVIPRISIDHSENVFKNNITGEKFEKLTAVLLGLVKQRIFWRDGNDFEDGEKPLCKSTDAANGFPQMRTDIPSDQQFPWAESNFDPAAYPARPEFNNLIVLPCKNCTFAQWRKDPKNPSKNLPPPCNEQFTYPMLYVDSQGNLVPALFTVQKTGIKPAKTYNSYFASSRTPFFTVYTTLSLTPQSRGMVRWAVPEFARGDQTDRANWSEWGNQARQIREFIRQPPRNNDDDSLGEESDNTNRGPESAASASATEAPPAPAASNPPPAASTPAPSAPASPPPSAPAAPPAPSTPAPAAAAPAEAAVPAAESAADDDDIPF